MIFEKKTFKNREYAVAVAKINKHTHKIKGIKFKTINNGINYWVADPFPIEKDGKLFIFGEIYEYTKLKGSIAYTQLTDSGFTKWKKIIEEPYHLSFPNIFYIGDNLYMCPESHESRQLYLYKCEKFPHKWKKDKILANNGNFNDTVFLKYDNELLGFTCEWKDINNHQFKIFKLTGDIIEFFNPSNIKTLDYYLTRPAGKIFFDEIENRNIMVSQICNPIYGSGLIFKSFNINFPYYEEYEISRIYPADINCDLNKPFDGIHTFNMSDNYVVVDLIWSRFNFIEKMSRLIHKLVRRKQYE